MSKRFFTVEEANALVPKLSLILERIRVLKAEITSRIPEVYLCWRLGEDRVRF